METTSRLDDRQKTSSTPVEFGIETTSRLDDRQTTWSTRVEMDSPSITIFNDRHTSSSTPREFGCPFHSCHKGFLNSTGTLKKLPSTFGTLTNNPNGTVTNLPLKRSSTTYLLICNSSVSVEAVMSCCKRTSVAIVVEFITDQKQTNNKYE